MDGAILQMWFTSSIWCKAVIGMLLLTFLAGPVPATDLFVDPVHGDDGRSGLSADQPLRTLTAAWLRIPEGAVLTHPYRIRLEPGTYARDMVPPGGWLESRLGTSEGPVVLEAVGDGVVVLPEIDLFDCHHIALRNLTIAGGAGGGNVLHLASCTNISVLGCRLLGEGDVEDYDGPQEVYKANQCRNLTIEDSELAHAFGTVLDLVAVEGASVSRNRIHHALDWCAYAKGGSAGIRFEANDVWDGEAGGIAAGQGTGFEYMVPPRIHFESTEVRIVNNIIHDCHGAGLGVHGSSNVLIAYNTLYRVGAASHVFEAVHGSRSCDGDVETCQRYLALGGWGTAGAGFEAIPNRNVYVLNNLVVNPVGAGSTWSLFRVAGPATPPAGSNVPSPAFADEHLMIRGNVILNGPSDHPLGLEDSRLDPVTVLRENAINTLNPVLVDPESGDYRPVHASLAGITVAPVAPFPDDDPVLSPPEPPGVLENTVPVDRNGVSRLGRDLPGALLSFAPLPIMVPGGAGVPQDYDGDGRYEDVNGNGRHDFADIVLFFNRMTWIAEHEPVAAFDINGNGRIDFADVVSLFNRLSGP